MNRTNLRFIAITAALCASTSIANAAFVQWNIDEAVSKVTLAIPDQTLVIDSTNATLRIRNQTGSGSTWNLGNSANVNGFLNSYYRETATSGVHDLQFTSNPVGQFVGLNSGNYRPNPARYSTAATDSVNTEGSFTGSSASDFPAVFAGRIRPTVLLTTVEFLYFNLYDTSFNITSSPMLVSGTTGGSFNPISGSLQSGLLNSSAAYDGVNTGLAGQLVPDRLRTVGPTMGSPTTVTAATVTDLGGQNRRLNLTVATSVVLVLDDTPINATISSTIVAYATVPEPSTMMMAGIGLAGLIASVRRRFSHAQRH